MPKEEKIDALVATVHELNHSFRPRVNETIGGDPPGNPFHHALGELLMNERSVSLQVRALTIADLTARDRPGEIVEQVPVDETSSRRLLSSFGTAREAILSILRTLEVRQWEEVHETPDGQRTIESLVDGLIESDKKMVANIRQAV